jgi:hypothetical protein
LFSVAVLSFLGTAVWFYYELHKKRVKMHWHLGAPPDAIYFEKYDSLFALLATCVMSIPWVLLNSPWLFPWLALGWFLYATKLLTMKPVHDFWLKVYSGGDNYVLDGSVDTRQLNMAIFSEIVFESTPQLLIQSINSGLLDEFTPIAYLSISISAVMILDGIYRLIFYKVYLGIDLVDVPTGFEDTDNNDDINKTLNVEMGSEMENPMTTTSTSTSVNKASEGKADTYVTVAAFDELEERVKVLENKRWRLPYTSQ